MEDKIEINYKQNLCLKTLLGDDMKDFLKLYNTLRGKIIVQWCSRDDISSFIETLISGQEKGNFNKIKENGVEYMNIVHKSFYNSTYVELIQVYAKIYFGYLKRKHSLWDKIWDRNDKNVSDCLISDLTIWKVVITVVIGIWALYNDRNLEEIIGISKIINEKFSKSTREDRILSACIVLRIFDTISMNIESLSDLNLDSFVINFADIPMF